MKKSILVFALLMFSSIGFVYQSQAQVKGVGLTLSPVAEHVWWDKNSGLKNGYMAGGQLGFSFGEYVELRGLYLTSLDQKRDFSEYLIEDSQLENVDLKISRIGGDLKLNLGRGKLLPYFTIGTGVQNMQFENQDKNQQIYFTGGLGFLISFDDRATLGIQGLYNTYKDDPFNSLLTETEKATLGSSIFEKDYERMVNWSARASLQFYLGGRRPNQLSEIDEAYLKTFSSGLKGISLPFEPMVTKINWASKLPYKDANFAGLATGLDFGPLVGVRVYYLRSFEDKVFDKFDKLEIWGAEGKFKLNSSGVLVPFLTLGGGKINVMDGYENEDLPLADTTNLKDRAFASGGGGFDIVLSRHVKLSAFAKAMLTSSSKSLENTNNPDQISTSWQYGASLNFIIGKKPENPSKAITKSYDQKLMDELAKERENTNAVLEGYKKRIAELETEMAEAYKAGDSMKMSEAYQERENIKEAQTRLTAVSEKEKVVNSEAYRSNDAMMAQMMPSEMRSLVDEIKQSQLNSENVLKQNLEMQNMKNDVAIDKLNTKMDAMSDLIRKLNADQKDDSRELRKKLDDDYKKLNRQITALTVGQAADLVIGSTDNNNKVAAEPQVMVVSDSAYQDSLGTPAPRPDYILAAQVQNRNDSIPRKGFFRNLNYEGASVLAGFGIGGDATFNIGLRQHYRIKTSQFYIIPEAFFGFGSPASFGLFVNGVYQMKFKKPSAIEPYAGLGCGFMQVGEGGDEKIKLASNIIIGTNFFRLGGGRFYADWNARNFFKHNQIALGYRLPF